MPKLVLLTLQAPPLRELPVPTRATTAGVLQAAADRAATGVRGALATVIGRHGSTPGTPGQKLYLAADGTCVGTVGGGAVERAVLEALGAMLAAMGTEAGTGVGAAKHEVRTFELGPELGMCCGGRLDVMLEPVVGVVPCLVVGGGHVATELAPMLARLGFDVTVVDSREAWAAPDRLAGVHTAVGPVEEVGGPVDPAGVCLVMTHDHALDQKAIEWALRRGFAFVGAVGSRAKAARTRYRLEAAGFPAEDLARVRMPLGVDVGARLPEEIAVSIAAEMVAWKRGKA
ncbi:XdhC family protein [Cellulomonas fimi]|uniref:XdhC/CoxF family protein n=1 Tax=Cellulomonas fimi TaxID=1708 RepID=A0A7Y0LVS8_CELFI|nr:XdhC/CoxI family protein [Cellulomonas fimi]NMR18955.1 XdhC/CoxF family protein [Cellulomonas fimi]